VTGSQKPSVIDAERLFNPNLERFVVGKGYQFEANYVRITWNWRRANDEQGLTERARSKYDYQFYNMILDVLMPWHNEQYNFSLLEVNR